MTTETTTPEVTTTERDGKIEITTYVKTWQVANVEAKLAQLAKRAARVGVAAPRLIVHTETTRRAWQLDHRHTIIRDQRTRPEVVRLDEFGNGADWFAIQIVDVTLIGETIQLPGGWSLVAAIRHDRETGLNVVSKVPGAETEVPVELWRANNTCDHCRTTRRRNTTYLVRDSGGSLARVGSNCLAEFLGCDPTRALWLAETYGGAADNIFAGFTDSPPDSWGAERLLSVVSMLIRDSGWVSKGAANRDGRLGAATADIASAYVTLTGQKHAETFGSMRPDDTDVKIARAALEWAEKINFETAEDYLRNLYVVATRGYADRKTFGLACSMIAAHARSRGEALKARLDIKYPKASEEFFGTVGTRHTAPVRAWCVSVRYSHGQYGTTTIYKFVTEGGHRLTWFASRGVPGLDATTEGFEVILTSFRVKKHDTYNGKRSTVINRANVTLVDTPSGDDD